MKSHDAPVALPAESALARPSMREDLRLALVLGLACGLATAALFPYLLLVMPQALAKLPMPLPAVALLQSLQSFVLLTLLSFCGLRMGHRLGLGAPWLRALVFRRERVAQPWLLAVACGALAGIAIVALDPLFAPYMPKPMQALPASPQAHAFAGFLASFYGGIAEECMMRLFLVTLVAWVLCLASKGTKLRWHLVAAIVIAALLFGAGERARGRVAARPGQRRGQGFEVFGVDQARARGHARRVAAGRGAVIPSGRAAAPPRAAPGRRRSARASPPPARVASTASRRPGRRRR
jgi:hypothetical protein